MKAPLIALLMLLACSCGTRKAAIEEFRDIRHEEAGQVLEGSDMVITISDNMAERLQRERAYTITVLSSPDSAGRQWPVSIEEGMVTEDYAVGRLTTKDSTAIQRRAEQTSATTVGKSQRAEKTNVNTRLVPAAVWWFLLVGGVIAAILAWQKYKKR